MSTKFNTWMLKKNWPAGSGTRVYDRCMIAYNAFGLSQKVKKVNYLFKLNDTLYLQTPTF